MRATRIAASAAGFHLLPTVTALSAVRRRVAPRLCGVGRDGHVALTFDDGPHQIATPRLLDLLAERGASATFFILGTEAAARPELVRRASDAGHEIAVHGWTHRNHLLRSPIDVAADLRRTVRLVRDLTGAVPRYWRPPYGIATGSALAAAGAMGLTPVLWTAWGRDWVAGATRETIDATVRAELHGGGTILLHDSDVTSAPGSWRATLAAVPAVLDGCAERGWQVGPVREHFGARR